MIHRITLFGCAFVLAASAAAAQVARPPARSAARASDRTEQAFTLQGNLLGGYEDNLVPPGGGDVLAPHPSGYTGFGDTSLLYSIGNPTRSLEASVGGYMNRYSNVGVGPVFGGEQRLKGRTYIGRRTEITLNQGLRYAPNFSLGLFDAVQPDLGRSNSENPTNGLGEKGSWTAATSASVVRQWTRRTSTDGAYAFSRQTYVDGGGFDSRSHSGTLGYKHSFGRALGMRATYQHSDAEFDQAQGAVVPILTRTVDGGFTFERRFSATRELSLSGGAGASHVDTVEQKTGQPEEYWTPSGYGAIRMDIARSWSVGGDYRRSNSVLQGNTPEPFTSHTAQLSVGGDARGWLESVFSVGYSNGISGTKTQTGDQAQYDGYTGTVQLRVRMSAGWSSIFNLTHFEYRLNDEASRSLGVSRDLQRNAIRVGLAWSLPLYSSN